MPRTAAQPACCRQRQQPAQEITNSSCAGPIAQTVQLAGASTSARNLVSHAPKYAVGRPRVMHQHDSGHAQTEYKEAGDNSLWQTACSMQLLPEDSQ